MNSWVDNPLIFLCWVNQSKPGRLHANFGDREGVLFRRAQTHNKARASRKRSRNNESSSRGVGRYNILPLRDSLDRHLYAL